VVTLVGFGLHPAQWESRVSVGRINGALGPLLMGHHMWARVAAGTSGKGGGAGERKRREKSALVGPPLARAVGPRVSGDDEARRGLRVLLDDGLQRYRRVRDRHVRVGGTGVGVPSLKSKAVIHTVKN